jgi:cardiolipin synthase A/B
MLLRLLVDFDSFWASLCADVAGAREAVYVQTFSFEGDAVGLELAALLGSSRAVDRRVLADSFTRYVISDKFRFAPRHWFDRELRGEARATRAMVAGLAAAGVPVKFTNPPRLTTPNFLRRDHKKIVVVDDRIAYVGGINFSEHNAAWHDLMLRIEDASAARFLRDDFLSTWKGESRAGRGSFGELTLSTLDGRANERAFADVLGLIDAAREEIFVESPYVSFPFFGRLRAARQRGVKVDVVVPGENNWGSVGRYIERAAARSGVNLHRYPGRMTHLKAMLIDRECLILGSSNFDYLSYKLHQELLAFVTAPEVIADFRRRVSEPDVCCTNR